MYISQSLEALLFLSPFLQVKILWLKRLNDLPFHVAKERLLWNSGPCTFTETSPVVLGLHDV